MDLQFIIQITINGILMGGLYSLISTGLTLIFGVLKIINFAHGEFLMIGMYFYYWMNTLLGIPFYILLILTPVFLFLVSILIYITTIKHVLNTSQLNQLLLTGGLMMVLQNLAVMLWSSDYRSCPFSFGVYKVCGINIPTMRLFAFILSLAASLTFFMLLKKTDVGRAIRATAENKEAASLIGINSEKIFLITFGLGAAMVGVASALAAPLFWIYPTVGQQFGLLAFVIVVLGGLGNFYGALMGSFIIGLAEAWGSVLIAAEYQQFVPFCIFVLILIFLPEGIAGLRRVK
ncbi:MAG: branched-chain amino acid ABC transporter permease [Candidatus Micrarchaeia archaeon]